MPPVNPEPFDLGSGSHAVLCLHGLTGTPYEVRPVAEALAKEGFRAVGPRLPGHGGDPRVLARTTWSDWFEAAREAHGALRGEHARVSVLGLSLGGLLGLALAAEVRVDALAALGTPLTMRSKLRWLLPVVKYTKPLLIKRGGSDIRDAVARGRHPSMPVMPTASLQQLGRLQRRVRAGLVRVTSPLLIGHGRLDATAHPDDARAILEGVSSPERELLWLPNSGHVLPVDFDGPELARGVVAFLARPRPPLR